MISPVNGRVILPVFRDTRSSGKYPISSRGQRHCHTRSMFVMSRAKRSPQRVLAKLARKTRRVWKWSSFEKCLVFKESCVRCKSHARAGGNGRPGRNELNAERSLPSWTESEIGTIFGSGKVDVRVQNAVFENASANCRSRRNQNGLKRSYTRSRRRRRIQ